MNWFTLSIFSVFSLAAAELVQQNLLNKKNSFNEKASGVLTFLFQALLALLFVFALGLESQLFDVFEKMTSLKILLVSFISSIAMVLYLGSFRVKNISYSLVLVSFSAVVSSILGIIFFSESAGVLKFLGIFLILSGIYIVNRNNAKLEKRHFWGLIAGAMFGVNYVLDKNIVQDINPLVYIFGLLF